MAEAATPTVPDNSCNKTDTHLAYTPPTVRFRTLTFSDGSVVELGPSDIVVLVGPNNAGKSVALKELEQWVRGRSPAQVVKAASVSHTGTPEDFASYLSQHTQIVVEAGTIHGPGFSVGIGTSEVSALWPRQISNFAPLFCTRASTETRITESNPAPGFAALKDTPSNPIHLLYQNDELEDTISKYFHRAFGYELIVHRLGGNEVPLLVGRRPTATLKEDRLSNAYNTRMLASSVPLEKQGDGMRSFASVILRLLAPTTPSVLLLDEPEAFLHPPQARLLGEIITRNKPSEAQLFIATHSPDVLHGLISIAPENLHVLRMQREDNINRVHKLDKELVKKVSRDPLMMQSSVMSGVFHERVIICESDADSMFYSSVLNVPSVHGDRYPDVLFIQANGKHRMATLAATFVELGVPVDVIADMDTLNDIDNFKKIVDSLGGQWDEIESLAHNVKAAIEENKPWLTGFEIKKSIEEVLPQVPDVGPFPSELKSKIQGLFRKASPWDAIKQAGAHAIPKGQATGQFNQLDSLCRAAGLWIVNVGEVEGFCRSVGGHGPRWVQKILENRDLENDVELRAARDFLSQLWAAR